MIPDDLCSEEIHEITTALSAAQGAYPAIPKDRTVRVRSRRTGTEYTFKYATLDAVLSAVRPVLAKNGLSVTQLAINGALRTILMHSSGQYISHDLPMTYHEDPQEFGSEMTYKRRYGIVSILCVAADEDEDGNAASGNEIVSSQNRPPVEMPHPQKPPDILTPKEVERFRAKIASIRGEIGTDAFAAAIKHYGTTEPELQQIVGRKTASQAIAGITEAIDAIQKGSSEK